MKHLDLGCTKFRHGQIGIHAVVNARAGLQILNSQSMEHIELIRDGRNIKNYLTKRIRFYQFNSKYFRRSKQVQHLLSSHDD